MWSWLALGLHPPMRDVHEPRQPIPMKLLSDLLGTQYPPRATTSSTFPGWFSWCACGSERKEEKWSDVSECLPSTGTPRYHSRDTRHEPATRTSLEAADTRSGSSPSTRSPRNKSFPQASHPFQCSGHPCHCVQSDSCWTTRPQLACVSFGADYSCADC